MAKKNYRAIYKYGEKEILIRKSRFIGYTKPIETEEEGIEFINEIKEKNREATHNVYAYLVGATNNIQRYSDDGEPSGTAGIPILELLKKEELKNVVVVVTRYYGGIKLGVGGLIRAYIQSAKASLEEAIIVEQVLHDRIKFRIDYTSNGKVENELIKKGYIIDDIVYDDAVNYEILSKKNETKKLIESLNDITSGEVQYNILDEEYMPVKDGEIVR